MKNKGIFTRGFLSLLLSLALLLCITGGMAFSAGVGDDWHDEDFVPGEVLAPADSLQQAQAIAAAYGLELKSYAYGVAVFAAPNPELAVAQSQAIAAAAQNLPFGARLPELSLNMIYYIIEPEEEYLPDYGLNPYATESEWELYGLEEYGESQWQHEFMESELAWGVTKGEGVVIAIIDTGIDLGHPKFAGRIMPNSYNSYTDQIGLAYVQDDEPQVAHGTHVSGIAAASMEGNTRYCGVAPAANILAIKANITRSLQLESSSWVRGLNYAVANGADVVNMSFGRRYSGGVDTVAQNAIASAAEKGVVMVCAAGNDSEPHAGYPAAYPETVAVAALDSRGLLAGYSNYGPEIDVAAPGSAIYSTAPGGGFRGLSGTSMAAPMVAGVAALIKSLNPTYSAEQIKDVIRQSARKTSFADKELFYGYGLVNAYIATQWDGNIYTITYDYNDGIHPLATVKLANSSKVFEPDYPQRAGYAFGGWFTSIEGNEEDAFNFSSYIYGNLTLYAKWVIAMPGMFIYEFPDPVFCREALKLVNQGGMYRTPMSIINADDISIFAACYSLAVANRDISSLKGIEYYTGLHSLFCGNNRLEELDLSQNANLRWLYCFSNRLTELDLSKNPFLSILNCSKNMLAKIDISNNTVLKTMLCQQNMLTALDLSTCDNLVELICDFNNITLLDTSNNQLLEVLWCESNILEKLDFSYNYNLQLLYCENNLITELNVSKSPELEHLWCDNNRLTKLDISNNLYITSLNCTYNNMQTPDDVIGWQKTNLKLGSTFLFYLQNGQHKAETPVIIGHPQNIYSTQNKAVTLTVAAEVKRGALSYQWYTLNTPIPGATSTSYEAPARELGTLTYYCLVTNTDNSAIAGFTTASAKSYSASVWVLEYSAAEMPIITAQPTDMTVSLGGAANLSVTANVTKGELSYQWYSNTSKTNIQGKMISDATSSTYSAPTTETGTSYYYCVVANTDFEHNDGSARSTYASNAASVTVTPGQGTITFAGAILYQPSSTPATITLYDNNSGQDYITTTASDGAFALSVPIAPSGTRYTLKVTKPGYLSYTINNLALTDGDDIGTIDIRQLAGDVNGDGIVNAVDLTCLLSEFNRDPLIFREADIDGNGIVNAADLTYLLAGFNKRDVAVEW